MKFNNIQNALEVLMERNQFITEYKFENIRNLANRLNNPQDQLTIIHIGGTNGKGSTTDYLRSILQTQGYKVATFTSPHLISHHDRFKINNIPISDEDLLRHINLTTPYWEEFSLSMFEIDVFIAVNYFIEQEVDLAIFEVGLGGRIDATNIVNPICSVITNIGYDHMQILGNTLAEIAHEKAGIIKETGLVLTGEKNPVLLQIFKDKAQREVIMPEPVKHYQIYGNSIVYTYRDQQVEIPTVALYQIDNSKLAYETAYQLNEHQLVKISQESILTGLKNTFWQGRFEKMSETPPIFIDGAHNEAGIDELAKTLSYFYQPITIVFSALEDKNYDKMLKKLELVTNDIIVTEFTFKRASTTENLAKNHKVQSIKDYKEAIEQGINHAKAGGGILVITGSLYFISDVRQYLKER